MGEMWRRIRNRLAQKLNEPQLKQIPLRNLRHHYATKTYDQTKDILLVMQKLGHKKIQTTMLYTQLITFSEEDEYTVKTATNIKEATDLLEHGFTYIQEIDGIRIYRKRNSKIVHLKRRNHARSDLILAIDSQVLYDGVSQTSGASGVNEGNRTEACR